MGDCWASAAENAGSRERDQNTPLELSAAHSDIIFAQNHGSNKQMIRFATDILDRLDEVQRDILLGNLSKDRLIKLAQQLRSKKRDVSDPALLQIIKDIELRAAVELAKYS